MASDPHPLVRVMLAVTVDGFIAREDGSFDFLDRYSECFTDWDDFIAGIDTVVMGRSTYEQAIELDRWLYKDKRIRVLTSRPIDDAPNNVEAFDDAADLVTRITSDATGDIWHMGGGLAIEPFERAGLIDRWEIYTVPVRLGRGIPLFRSSDRGSDLRLTKLNQLPQGVIEAWYEPAEREG